MVRFKKIFGFLRIYNIIGPREKQTTDRFHMLQAANDIHTHCALFDSSESDMVDSSFNPIPLDHFSAHGKCIRSILNKTIVFGNEHFNQRFARSQYNLHIGQINDGEANRQIENLHKQVLQEIDVEVQN